MTFVKLPNHVYFLLTMLKPIVNTRGANVRPSGKTIIRKEDHSSENVRILNGQHISAL